MSKIIPTTSMGHEMSDPTWLDTHFLFSQTTYEAMVQAIHIQQGWHVLDSGCGSGSFLPLLAAQVGPTGKISADDLAPENIAAVESRLKKKSLACPVNLAVSGVCSMPYPDHTFDCAWSANVTQYLTDEELSQMMREFYRIVKPGGLVVIKDIHLPGIYFSIVPHLLLWRFFDILYRKGEVHQCACLRTGSLARWYQEAGIPNVKRQFFSVEKSGPLLQANDRQFVKDLITYLAEQALLQELPKEDLEQWKKLADLSYIDNELHSPDFFIRSEYIQFIGRVP